MSQAQDSKQRVTKAKGRVKSIGQYYHNISRGPAANVNIKRLQSLRKQRSTSQMKDRNILDGDVKKKILNFLKDKKHPQKTLTIAKACNFLTSKEINPTIYQLQREGDVMKCESSPPTWTLSSTETSKNTTQVNNTKNRNREKSTSASSRVSTILKTNLASSAASQKQPKLVNNYKQVPMGEASICSNSSSDQTKAPGAYVPKDTSREETHGDPFYQSGKGGRRPYYNQVQQGKHDRLIGNKLWTRAGTGAGFHYGNDGFSLQSNHIIGHPFHKNLYNNHMKKNQKKCPKNRSVAASKKSGSASHSKPEQGKSKRIETTILKDSPVKRSPHMEVSSFSSFSVSITPTTIKNEGILKYQFSSQGDIGMDNDNKGTSDDDIDYDDEDEDYDNVACDDSDEIQTRIRDMIFTSRAIEPYASYVDSYEDDDDDDDDDREASDEMILNKEEEEDEEIELWEEGLPDNPSSASQCKQQAIQRKEEDVLVDILEILLTVPMGITTKSVLSLKLGLSENEIESYLVTCLKRELVNETEIGFIKITRAGMLYLKRLVTSPPAAGKYNQNVSSNKYTAFDEVAVMDKSSKNESETTSVSLTSLNQKSDSGILSDSKKFNHSDNHISPCSGPAPSPAFLLKNSSLFKMDPHVQPTNTSSAHGVGRGQILNQIIGSSRPGIQSSGSEQNQILSGHDAILSFSFFEQPSNSDNTQKMRTGSVERYGKTNSCSGTDNLIPKRTPNLFTHSSTQSLSSSLSPSSPSASPLQITQTVSSKLLTTSIQQLGRPQPLLETPPGKLCPQQQHRQQQLATSLSLAVHQTAADRRPPLLETPISTGLSPSSSCGHTPFFTSSTLPVKQPLLPDPGLNNKIVPVTPALDVSTTNSAALQINSESFAALNKNPISAFMEYAQSRKLTSELKVTNAKGPAHKPLFYISAFLGNRRLSTVTCHNKKDGRKSAAEQAMRALINEGVFQIKEEISVMKMSERDMTPFDKIAALTHQKFNQLIASIPESFTGRKVIAGMVVKMGESDVGSVIAIGSGNRCITGDKLSLEGQTVNDCHAEIITRRGFLRFLYQQLATYKNDCDHPIFEKSPTSKKLKVKDNVTFHLYISTAPCGDGALFSPRDAGSNAGALADIDGIHHPTFTTQVHGVLRTKMEGGEGTIPINPAEIVQTWDGIVRGERLRTMSCSDKICRWNVLGLQGALLSHFVDTIYLSSLTLGFLFDHGHLSRAVCCRLDRGDTSFKRELPQGYRLNHPTLGRVTACDPPRETQKTKSYSINWSAFDERPELLDGTLGHCHTGIENKIISRITKENMYRSFKSLCGYLGRQDLMKCSSYLEAKQMGQDFMSAKKILMRQFVKSKCGTWVSKPIEEEMFN